MSVAVEADAEFSFDAATGSPGSRHLSRYNRLNAYDSEEHSSA